MREKQKAEGRRRLQMLNVMDNVLTEYDKGVIYYSERLSEQFNATGLILSER